MQPDFIENEGTRVFISDHIEGLNTVIKIGDLVTLKDLNREYYARITGIQAEQIKCILNEPADLSAVNIVLNNIFGVTRT